MKTFSWIMAGLSTLLGGLVAVPALASDSETGNGAIVQFGKMHEAIGKQQHEGRVRFADLLKRPHFFGVGALEGLRGESTIYDGEIILTVVDTSGRPQPNEGSATEEMATLLVGAYVPQSGFGRRVSDVLVEFVRFDVLAHRSFRLQPGMHELALDGEEEWFGILFH